MVLENNFDRGDELDADRVGIQLAQKLGYAPALGDFLTRLDERNKDQAESNGLFASHPETAERIDQDSGRRQPAPDSRARRAAIQERHQIPADAASPRSPSITEGPAGLTGSVHRRRRTLTRPNRTNPRKRALDSAP